MPDAALDDQLLDIVADEALIDREKLVPGATLADVGLDSVGVVSVIFAVEEKFGIEIAEDAFADVSNLRQFLDVIEAMIAAKPRS